MNTNSQKKQVYIDFILDQFAKGEIERKNILAQMVEKWQISTRSFDRYFSQAHTIHTEQRQAINTAKLTDTMQKEFEAVTSNLLQKHEALEMLSSTAKLFFGKIQDSQDAKDAAALIACIDRIAKIEGFDAPIKSEFNNILISPTLKVEYTDD